MSSDSSVLIGELAARHGVSVEAIRYYESQGLLSPGRDASGRRVFDPAQQRALEVVVALREAGLGIREIASVVALKQPGTSVRERLDAAVERLSSLRDEVDVRRARLDRAAALLTGWHDDAVRARGELEA